MNDLPAPHTRVLLVSGVSGAGKSSALKQLEDLGFEAVDNMPLSLVARLVLGGDGTDAVSGNPAAVTRSLPTVRCWMGFATNVRLWSRFALVPMKLSIPPIS